MLRMEERTCFKEDEDAWATTGMISGVVVTSSRNFHRNTRNFRVAATFAVMTSGEAVTSATTSRGDSSLSAAALLRCSSSLKLKDDVPYLTYKFTGLTET